MSIKKAKANAKSASDDKRALDTFGGLRASFDCAKAYHPSLNLKQRAKHQYAATKAVFYVLEMSKTWYKINQTCFCPFQMSEKVWNYQNEKKNG